MNQQVELDKLASLHHCDGGMKSLDFGDLDLIFKVTLAPWNSRGARWLSGRVSDSGARGPGFETYRRRVLEQDTLLPESTG